MVGTTHLTIELALRARSQGRTETMKTGIRIACWIPILLAIATPAWALEPIGPASEIVLQALRERGDGEPSMEDLVDALNRVTVGFLHAGQYAQAEITVHEALEMGERDLGREHSATLTVLSNLASLFRVSPCSGCETGHPSPPFALRSGDNLYVPRTPRSGATASALRASARPLRRMA